MLDVLPPDPLAAARLRRPLAAGTVTVLAVDDNESNRYIAARILRRAGYHVVEAGSGEEALGLLALEPDLVLLDVKLPRMNGLEVCRQIKSNPATESIPVLHLSASHTSATDQAIGLDGGADGYLVAPVDPNVLIATVRSLLRMRAAVDRLAALQAITAALSTTLSETEVARCILGRVVRAVSAVAGSVFTLRCDDGACDLLDTLGYPDELLDACRGVELAAVRPLAEGFLRGRAIVVASPEEAARRFPPLLADAAAGRKGWAVIPLVLDGRALGGIALSFDTPRVLAREELELLSAVAGQCAQALDRVRLNDARRRADEERVLLLEQERKAREEAETAKRAREDILTIVAHDLRTPLHLIGLAVSVLEMNEGKDDAFTRVLSKARSAIDQMDILMRDLVDAGSLEAEKLSVVIEPCDATALVREWIELFLPAAEEKAIRLDVELPGVSEVIACDRRRVVQALSNLLGNALKFTPSGRKITIRLEPREADLRVTVADEGPGIPAETLPRLFDRFWHGKHREGGGTGLGLFICRGIALAHGGDVTVESEVGRGSVFTLRLPRGRSNRAA